MDRHSVMARYLFAVCLAALSTGGLAPAQGRTADDEAPRYEVRGTVADPEGTPLEGALVSLYRRGDEVLKTKPVVSNAGGSWTIPAVPAGPWQIVIDRRGYVRSTGTIVVGPDMKDIAVRLRPLDEVPPLTSEGLAETVASWLEVANSLVRDGRGAEAAEYYLRAYPALKDEDRAALLQALARAYYLAEEMGRCVDALERALRLEPKAKGLRELYLEVRRATGTEDAGRAFLAALDRGAAPPVAPLEIPPPRLPKEDLRGGEASPRTLPERPVETLSATMTGRHRVRLPAPHPGVTAALVAEHFGDTLEGTAASLLDKATYEVYVPRTDRPLTGALVWVSPSAFGGVERPQMLALLDDLRILWIGANDSGNSRPAGERVALALHAIGAVEQFFHLGADRVVIGGYSGGGRIASRIAMALPEWIGGALLIKGTSYYRSLPLPDRPGATWGPSIPLPAPEVRRRLLDVRYALLTGTRDFNRMQTAAVRDALLAEGATAVGYFEIPGASHYGPIPTEQFEKALRFALGLPGR